MAKKKQSLNHLGTAQEQSLNHLGTARDWIELDNRTRTLLSKLQRSKRLLDYPAGDIRPGTLIHTSDIFYLFCDKPPNAPKFSYFPSSKNSMYLKNFYTASNLRKTYINFSSGTEIMMYARTINREIFDIAIIDFSYHKDSKRNGPTRDYSNWFSVKFNNAEFFIALDLQSVINVFTEIPFLRFKAHLIRGQS